MTDRAGTPPDNLTRADLGRHDGGTMLAEVLNEPRHLCDAVTDLEKLRLPWPTPPAQVLVAGVGGTAIAGELAAALLGPRAPAPIRTVHAYQAGPGVGPDTLVICLSHSGNTDSTVAYFADAAAAGARVVAVTNGGALHRLADRHGAPVIGLPAGVQPRAKIVYMLVAVLACAAPLPVTELLAAAGALDRLTVDWGPDAPADSPAKALARALFGTLPVVHGVGPTVAAAARWCTQLDETGKHLAFPSDLIDTNHYEVEAWRGGIRPANAVAVFLDAAADQHPAAVRRMRLTERVLAEAGVPTHRVPATGDSRAARLLSLVLLGDLVSVYLAALRDMNPSTMPLITRLNELIADRS